jgi:hypothetical protein
MEFNLQDIGVGNNSGLSDDSGPNSTFDWSDALSGLAIGVAQSAANVGLATLAKSQGVTASLPVNPYLQTSLLPRPALSSVLSSTGGSAVLVGAVGLIGLGLLLWVALRNKG